LLSAAGLLAQYRANPTTPFISGGFGSAVFPGGTSATTSGIVRFPPNVAFPGGGGPRLVVPFGSPFNSGFRRQGRSTGSVIYSYPYPVYVGNYSDYSGGGYVDPSAVPPAGPPPQAAASAPAAPVIINIGVPGPGPTQPGPPAPPEAYQQQPGPPQEDTSGTEPTHYLIALKDHTIYSAVAYWVDGSTLHYFTSGNVHNQVSLSLVDRELTLRLNKETGLQVMLPR